MAERLIEIPFIIPCFLLSVVRDVVLSLMDDPFDCPAVINQINA